MAIRENHPPRIPKGSKEGGQFMPKWVLEIREELKELRHGASQTRLDLGRLLFDDVNQETGTIKRGLMGRLEALESWAQPSGEKIDAHERTLFAQQKSLNDLRDRLGTSTPLIIWNILVLVAIAYLTAKVYGVAPY